MHAACAEEVTEAKRHARQMLKTVGE